jgi:hypothetical protein
MSPPRNRQRAVVNIKTEQRNTMSMTSIRESECASLPHQESGETGSIFRAALEQIDRIKIKLRAMSGDLTEVASLLKTAE